MFNSRTNQFTIERTFILVDTVFRVGNSRPNRPRERRFGAPHCPPDLLAVSRLRELKYPPHPPLANPQL